MGFYAIKLLPQHSWLTFDCDSINWQLFKGWFLFNLLSWLARNFILGSFSNPIQSILSGGSLSRPIWTYLTSLFRSLGGLVASVEMDLIETGAGSWWNLILPSLLCLLTVRRVSEIAQAPLGPRLLVCKVRLGVWIILLHPDVYWWLRLLTTFLKNAVWSLGTDKR